MPIFWHFKCQNWCLTFMKWTPDQSECFSPTDPATTDNVSPLGSPIVLQRKGSVYGANVPMITGTT